VKKKHEQTSTEEFEKSTARADPVKHLLLLYIAGMSPKSSRSIANVRKFCEENLKGRYELKVIDIYQQPNLAKEAQIIATPTLIKQLPLPLRKLIGNMSDTEKFFVGIDLKPLNLKVQIDD
jgi:circadian clock protein KaiB